MIPSVSFSLKRNASDDSCFHRDLGAAPPPVCQSDQFLPCHRRKKLSSSPIPEISTMALPSVSEIKVCDKNDIITVKPRSYGLAPPTISVLRRLTNCICYRRNSVIANIRNKRKLVVEIKN